jgi:ribonucleoside-diphosphate reductase alpha chain
MTSAAARWLDTAIARHIWQAKYRWIRGGVPQEDGIEDSWRRVARAAASVEPTGADHWAERFYGVLAGFRFLPGGRILAGAGTGRRVTLFNCFVMGQIRDDMEGIFEALKEGALTMQAGGGVGYDFSTLRPAASIARASDRIASGPLSFMQVWDAMCDTVLSTGARRGAMIASLRCDHPDIESFIDAKQGPGKLRHFNLSVQVTDAFMAAVRAEDDWPLVFPDATLQPDTGAETLTRAWPGHAGEVSCRVIARRPARALWQRIMRAAYDTAEPGVLFVDRINALNNLYYREHVATTNPCGEVPLPPYGACNLGSLNLVRFVKEPFTDRARLDLDMLGDTTRVAVRLLDNIIDCSAFPLEAQAAQARGSRRIGLGMTGLADALIMLELDYGGEAARREAGRAMQVICHAAYRSSIELAREKGSFPFLDRDAYLRGRFIASLPADIRTGIAVHGIRNSHLTAIAPAGTISLLAGNVSSGIEPVFEAVYRRKVLNRHGDYEEFTLEDYAVRLYREQGGALPELPGTFVASHSLSPEAHLAMQAGLQGFVDSAISKTVNVPAELGFDQFSDLYVMAYERGLKGCTAYRPNPVRGALLSAGQLPAGQVPDAHCCSIEREGE